MDKYIYEIENNLLRQLCTLVSACGLIVLFTIVFVCSTVRHPTQVRTHWNFLLELFTDSVFSMWLGAKHTRYDIIWNKYYK